MRYSDENQFFINPPKTSDAIHNINCYRFLCALTLPNKSISGVSEIEIIRSLKDKPYDEQYPYGALYTSFMGNLEAAISQQTPLQRKEYDAFFLSLYENENANLEHTYQSIKDIVLDKTPSSRPVQKAIEHAVKDQKNTLNPYTPSQAGSAVGRFGDMISPNYKATHKTSLASKRTYQYNQKSPSQELRFGTQGQTQNYWSRVSPLFQRFLTAQVSRNKEKGGKKNITHIYFNHLGKDRSSLSYEGRFESSLTTTLHRLEKSHPNIAVITLPADKGLMAHHDFFDMKPKESIETVKHKLLDIVLESSTNAINDFYISPKVRELLFKSKSQEKEILLNLLNTSFEALGFSGEQHLSPAQSQAVWVHFNKFVLPKFIIETLKPDTFNFSCKDAIDRGGISSAYYNLMSSFTTQTPMSRDEFETALHAAPVMVKGRGMNNHLNIIWNVVDQYMQANPQEITDPKKNWLVAWRDANCPKERAGELLERRLNECMNDLKKREPSDVIEHALRVLRTIQEADRSNASYHALFLDAAVSTYDLCLNPKNMHQSKKETHYQALIKTMEVHCAPPATYMGVFFAFLKSLFMSNKHKIVKKQLKELKSVAQHMDMWKKEKPDVSPQSPSDDDKKNSYR
ncbi:MAG: hypothetical protein CK424_06795 [Legionella sp.]|nr:MAG: hypothetical protein CK424_06795 [Legionella sp.]